MITVCPCGQKLRVKNLAHIDKTRCPACKANVADEVNRQAARNADIVLEVAAFLASKPESTWTKQEEVIARICYAHERRTA